MRYIQLGERGPQVSRIAFGNWSAGGDWGQVDRDAAISAKRAALEHHQSAKQQQDCPTISHGGILNQTADFGPQTSDSASAQRRRSEVRGPTSGLFLGVPPVDPASGSANNG